MVDYDSAEYIYMFIQHIIIAFGIIIIFMNDVYDVYIQRVFYMHQIWINPFSVPVGEQLSSC